MQVETIRALLLSAEREGNLDEHKTYFPNLKFIGAGGSYNHLLV